jgi:phosphoadenosine phosphosulfate reductase
MPKPKIDIGFYNTQLRFKKPDEIIKWALSISANRIVTTSFGIYSEVLLSTMSRQDKHIKVVWCDTLFNRQSTYEHAKHLIAKYNLNVYKYQSIKTKEEIEVELSFQYIDDDNFTEFSNLVKIEPFKRALKEHDPDIWFTNIRVRQTEYRDKKDILSYSKHGILKVSPFYYWSDEELDNYVQRRGLNKNADYFDPVKALKNRECGIHFE